MTSEHAVRKAPPTTPGVLGGPTKRISRRQFAWSYWPLQAVIVPTILTLLIVFAEPAREPIPGLFTLAALPILAVALPVMFMLAVGRLRDFGLPAAVALVCFLPGWGWAVVLVITFCPGSREPNKYGPPPYASGVMRPQYPNVVGIVSGLAAAPIWSAFLWVVG